MLMPANRGWSVTIVSFAGKKGMTHFDTIVAPITGPGSGAVAIVRVSGPDAWRIASEVFDPWQPAPMKAVYGRYGHGDDGIALPFKEGQSYTGEEAVELSIHGSTESVRELVNSCIDAGARIAEPGEFTQRAFLNGRIDLTQAEAVRDTIEARTEAQLRLANFQRDGSLRRKVESLRGVIGRVLASIEAAVDFSEEIGELDLPLAIASLCDTLGAIDSLLETNRASRILRQGLRVAIVGPPNAGKSSLLNAILGTDRAIVTEVPGTTRDFVEEEIELNGIPVVLIDTAGLRDSNDRVELIGIERTRAIVAAADHVWYVYDSSIGWSEKDLSFVELHCSESRPVTVLANKCDLAEGEVGIPVSAATSEGLASLIQSLPIEAGLEHREIAINSRHAEHLASARESLDTAIRTLRVDRPTDLATVLLQEALAELGQITGETASPDMISRIFSNFCIGK